MKFASKDSLRRKKASLFSEAEHFLFRSAETEAKPIHYLQHPPFSQISARQSTAVNQTTKTGHFKKGYYSEIWSRLSSQCARPIWVTNRERKTGEGSDKKKLGKRKSAETIAKTVLSKRNAQQLENSMLHSLHIKIFICNVN